MGCGCNKKGAGVAPRFPKKPMRITFKQKTVAPVHFSYQSVGKINISGGSDGLRMWWQQEEQFTEKNDIISD